MLKLNKTLRIFAFLVVITTPSMGQCYNVYPDLKGFLEILDKNEKVRPYLKAFKKNNHPVVSGRRILCLESNLDPRQIYDKYTTHCLAKRINDFLNFVKNEEKKANAPHSRKTSLRRGFQILRVFRPTELLGLKLYERRKSSLKWYEMSNHALLAKIAHHILSQ